LVGELMTAVPDVVRVINMRLVTPVASGLMETGTSTWIIKRWLPADGRKLTYGWRMLIQHRRVRWVEPNRWVREWRLDTDDHWHYAAQTLAGVTQAKEFLGYKMEK